MNFKQILLFISILFADQITKWAIDFNMMLGDSITIIPNFFRITYLHNTGAAWSMFDGKLGFFFVITIIAIILMIYFYRNTEKHDYLTQYGLVLMMAGTIGNFIDRTAFHYVRDFLDFIIFGYDFPVFNVADMALCIGVFLILVSVFFEQYYGGGSTCEK